MQRLFVSPTRSKDTDSVGSDPSLLHNNGEEDHHPQQQQAEDMLRVTLEGANMRNMDEGDWFGCSDCFWRAETPITGPDGTIFWQAIYRSETIMDSLNPQWNAAEFPIDDPDRPIRFVIMDWEKNLKHQPMGYFMASVHQLLASKAPPNPKRKEDGSLDLSLENELITYTPKNQMGEAFGTIVVANVEFREATKQTSVLKLTLEAVELVNMLGFFVSVNDPFFVVETPVVRDEDSHGTTAIQWKTIYQSEPVDDHEGHELRWEPFAMNVKDLCQNNIDKPIRISFFDEAEHGPPHISMGYCMTSVRQLLRSKARRLTKEERNKKYQKTANIKWDLTKALFLTNEDGQEFGQAVVVDVEMVTYD